jgi:hypothetical protein
LTDVVASIDERTLDNLMEGPWVRIEERSSRFATRVAMFNKAGFEKYARLVDEHRCDGLEGRNKLNGWETFHSATLENIEASHVPCRSPVENFPVLRNYAVNAYRGGDPFNASDGDIDLLADEFSGLFAPA